MLLVGQRNGIINARHHSTLLIRACVAERKQAVEMSLGDGDSFTDIKGNDVLRNPREFGEWDLTAPLEWLVVASKMYCEANAVQPSRFDDRRHNPEKKADDILDDIDDDAEILHQYLHAIRARRATLKGAAAAHHGQCGNRKEPVKTLGLECVCRRLKCLKQQCLVCELLGKKGMDTDTRIPWFREELLSKNQPPKPAPQPVPHSEVNW
ncbi:MAG: hypothetical protein M1831_004330 [Alyxoria varia]|nr:MAG: hypothetical protein M1831_004330 [Alyxoria varia]